MDRFPALIGSRRWRLALFAACYYAQGVPIGLLVIALPAWLAERGLSLGQIATYQAIISLPWGFKLLAGPVMDRFTFPPMGRRRPWVVAAQLGLTCAFLGLAVVVDPLAQLTLVIALAFLVNTFAAVQDVAVDGMAIDVLPETERGRANAFMAFGQVAGFSSFSALSGVLLTHYGLAVAAIVAALTVGVVFALVTSLRERPGERLLPWSRGAAARTDAPRVRTLLDVFRGLIAMILLPASVVLTLAEWLVRMRDGVAIAVFPVVATQTLGYASETYSSFQGTMGVVIAGLGILIGPLVDRYGAKPFYLLGIAGSSLTTLVFALASPLWTNDTFAIGAWIVMSVFGQIIFVSFIACAMSICAPAVAASQFAIYMSLSNLARSFGSYLFAQFAADLTVAQQFLTMALLLALAFSTMLFFRLDAHRERIRSTEASLPA